MGRKKKIRTEEEIADRKTTLAKRTAEWRRLNPEKNKQVIKNQNAKAPERRKALIAKLSPEDLSEIKDRNNEYMRRYRAENRAAGALSSKKYRERNPERSRGASKKWKEANAEKVSITAQKRNSNPDVKQNRNRARRETYAKDPLVVIRARLRNRTAAAFRAFGFKKGSRTAQILGSDWETVRDHIQGKFKEGMTWENRTLWHIDHITPIVAASNEDELNKLCHYTNLQPLWASENLAKSGRR